MKLFLCQSEWRRTNLSLVVRYKLWMKRDNFFSRVHTRDNSVFDRYFPSVYNIVHVQGIVWFLIHQDRVFPRIHVFIKIVFIPKMRFYPSGSKIYTPTYPENSVCPKPSKVLWMEFGITSFEHIIPDIPTTTTTTTLFIF